MVTHEGFVYEQKPLSVTRNVVVWEGWSLVRVVVRQGFYCTCMTDCIAGGQSMGGLGVMGECPSFSGEDLCGIPGWGCCLWWYLVSPGSAWLAGVGDMNLWGAIQVLCNAFPPPGIKHPPIPPNANNIGAWTFIKLIWTEPYISIPPHSLTLESPPYCSSTDAAC